MAIKLCPEDCKYISCGSAEEPCDRCDDNSEYEEQEEERQHIRVHPIFRQILNQHMGGIR